MFLPLAQPAFAQAGRRALLQARTEYNDGQYDQAIATASAISAAGSVDEARLVAGRAYLERFRRTGDTIDLAAARNDFRTLNPAHLDDHDRVQLLIGLGESLYLDDL